MSPRPLLLCALLLVAACGTSAAPAPATAPTPAAVLLKCGNGDHGILENQLGWGFCYPPSWRFVERLQSSSTPKGVDTTFDITDGTKGGTESGKFAFMIVGTYEIGPSTSLKAWISENVDKDAQVESFRWGNAREAYQQVGSSRRYALTPHRVVLMDPRSSPGNLDLEAEMAKRLDTWRFDY
jgi:hypothetical protein